jgi:hypothetical protein
VLEEDELPLPEAELLFALVFPVKEFAFVLSTLTSVRGFFVAGSAESFSSSLQWGKKQLIMKR